MIIIFDFDHTLFSTKKLYQTLEEEFKKTGVDNRLFSETFQKSKDNCYNPEKQFKLIVAENPELNPETLKEAFKKVIARAEEYLYLDVIPILENLKKENELIILSYGEGEFQKEKIENSKITKYFSKIIVTPEINKTSELKKILKEKKSAIFVEDNSKALVEAKKLFPNIVAVRINRNEGRYAKEQSNKGIDFIIEDLTGLEEILNKLESS